MIAGFKKRALTALQRGLGFLAWLFAVQLQVVLHPARRKAVLTPRRAGKTEMACVWLLDTAHKNPGKKLLYVALTRPNAHDIAWAIFQRLDRKFELGCHFQKSDLEITLPNGACILLRGADQENWIKKLEGQEFILIIVDEAGLYDISIRRLIYDSLSPMVDSCDGTICLIGRPGIVKTDLFWDVTRPDLRPGPKDSSGAWSVLDKRGGTQWAIFNWSTFENPHVADYWRAIIAERSRLNPEWASDPGVRRNYFGEWADSLEGLVYAFSEANIIEEYTPQKGDRYGATFDFGWTDATAAMAGCWNPARPELIVLESWKRRGMPLYTPPDQIENVGAINRLEIWRAKYPDLLMWGDPAKKQLFMEAANRFGTCVMPAQKEDKIANIELMNNDWALRNILVVRKTNLQFIEEITALKKLVEKQIADAALGEERPGEWKEHPRLANDLCDDCLYLWRNSMHYRYQEPKEAEPPGAYLHRDDWAKDYWAEQAEKAAERESREYWRR